MSVIVFERCLSKKKKRKTKTTCLSFQIIVIGARGTVYVRVYCCWGWCVISCVASVDQPNYFCVLSLVLNLFCAIQSVKKTKNKISLFVFLYWLYEKKVFRVRIVEKINWASEKKMTCFVFFFIWFLFFFQSSCATQSAQVFNFHMFLLCCSIILS